MRSIGKNLDFGIKHKLCRSPLRNTVHCVTEPIFGRVCNGSLKRMHISNVLHYLYIVHMVSLKGVIYISLVLALAIHVRTSHPKQYTDFFPPPPPRILLHKYSHILLHPSTQIGKCDDDDVRMMCV